MNSDMRISSTNRGWIFWMIVTLAFLVSVSGCRRTTPPGAGTVYARIEDTSYTFLHWKEGLRVMIWYDITENVGSHGSGSTSDPIHRQEGYASASDGRHVDWWLETADGQTATFNMNGQQYDLSRGTLFLVMTKGAEVQVRQLNRDLSAIPPTVEGCETFAKGDPDVSSFIREATELK